MSQTSQTTPASLLLPQGALWRQAELLHELVWLQLLNSGAEQTRLLEAYAGLTPDA